MGRLFGTDGVRGVANELLTCELALNLGRAAAIVLTKHLSHTPKILIGKDTRISCDMLEGSLAAGICSVGANAALLGVVPTPAVAYLVKKYSADAGVMISASHNPAKYNGIKIFSADGYKLPDSIEEEIEALMLDTPGEITLKTDGRIGRTLSCGSAAEDYIDHVISVVPKGGLKGLRVAIDCANGSASVTAAKLFTRLGADCKIIGCQPDGMNINQSCGSTHMEQLCRFTVEEGCDVGVAFDGDADRCLMVDEEGRMVDGDKLIAIAALHLKENERLPGDTTVVTVMSNLGFFHFAKDNNIKALSTKVGDRYVLEEMLAGGYTIGGEQSGHIIFLEHTTTGDGQLTAAILLSILKQGGKKMSELASVMQVYPQVLVNLRTTAAGKAKYAADVEIEAMVARQQKLLGDSGRILVRESGTEPLIRVMVEGKDLAEIDGIAHQILEFIKDRIS